MHRLRDLLREITLQLSSVSEVDGFSEAAVFTDA